MKFAGRIRNTINTNKFVTKNNFDLPITVLNPIRNGKLAVSSFAVAAVSNAIHCFGLEKCLEETISLFNGLIGININAGINFMYLTLSVILVVAFRKEPPPIRGVVKELEDGKTEVALTQPERMRFLEIAKGVRKSNFFNLEDPDQDGVNSYWMEAKYGPHRPKRRPRDPGYYRSYAQVSYWQIPSAVEAIVKAAEARAADGIHTHFKFLVFRLKGAPEWSSIDQLLENEIGRYVDHDISHPVIAMYGMSKEENNDLLERLAQTAEWQKIEEERDSDNRRPGSNSYFTHINGELKEFRSLNFLDYRGYSEDRIARLGSAWREEARGSKTRFR